MKYADARINSCFRAEIYDGKEDGHSAFFLISGKSPDTDTFVPGTEDRYMTVSEECLDIPAEGRMEYMSSHFADIFNKDVNILNPGEDMTMNLCLYVPVYDRTCWETARELILAVRNQKSRYRIDLLLFPYDMAGLIEGTSDPLKNKAYRTASIELLHEISEFASSDGLISHVLLLQNCNADGAGLDMDREKFCRIVGEFAMAYVCRYNELFNPGFMEPEKRIRAFGISAVSFDRFRFVQYLLHKAYLHILDRENVGQESVDINKVSAIAQDRLKDKVHIFKEFYDKHVAPALESHTDKNTIISGIRPDMDALLENLSAELQSFINDPELSLPEKKATLAQLLGEDDDLLEGYIFNKSQLMIDDCSVEVLDIFIDANNRLLKYKPEKDEEEPEKKEEDISQYAKLSSYSGEPVESAASQLGKIKAVRTDIKESSSYIRLKSKELEGLSRHREEKAESDKVLTKEGFLYRGTRFRLVDNPGPPLEETYSPSVSTPASSMDLRSNFTPVKSQGSLGSCTTFALTSIYEYILKKNHLDEVDLSERFLYYNVRKANGQENADPGSSYYDCIKSLGEHGICLEKYFPYKTNDIAEAPPQEAYSDAENRKVLKALNVNPELKDIKSALAEGYPVAISLKIYDSFSEGEGFISRPSEEAIASEKGGWHAMTVCGYSDENKFFIVRNSWGIGFGDNGYCYVPYSYMTDKRLIGNCCIISQISGNLRTEGADTKIKVSFDTTDNAVKAAIIGNLVNEEKYRLSGLISKYNDLTTAWHSLVQTLGKASVRDAICEGTVKRLDRETSELTCDYGRLGGERTDSLKSFKKETVTTLVVCSLVFAVFLGIFVLICAISDDLEDCVTSWWSWIFYAGMGITAVFAFLWARSRKRQKKDLDREYRGMMEKVEEGVIYNRKQSAVADIRMHIAGSFIDSIHTLSDSLRTKYNSMTSFVENLRAWREDELQGCSTCCPADIEPFIPVISDAVLDRYFDKEKDGITEGIRLYELFGREYKVDEQAIIAFKNDLKTKLTEELFRAVDGFSMFSYLSGKKKYPYLDAAPDTGMLFKELDRRSAVFARISAGASVNTKAKLLLIDADLSTERNSVEDMTNEKFREKPDPVESCSKYRMTLIQLCNLSEKEIDL